MTAMSAAVSPMLVRIDTLTSLQIQSHLAA